MSESDEVCHRLVCELCIALEVPISVDDETCALWLFLKYTTNAIRNTRFPTRVEVAGKPFFTHVMGSDYFSWELFGFHIKNFIDDMARYYPANAFIVDWSRLFIAWNLSLRHQVDHVSIMHKNDLKCQMDHNLVLGGISSMTLTPPSNVAVG